MVTGILGFNWDIGIIGIVEFFDIIEQMSPAI